MLNLTQVPAPRVPLVDSSSGLVSTEWFRFFNGLYSVVGANQNVIQPANGGTGLSAIPTNGQLLIGNAVGYTLNTLTPGAGISITNGAGSITLANAGVSSWSGGATGLTPATAATGDVTLSGVLGAGYGGTGLSSYAIGDMIYASGATALARLAAGTAGQLLTSAGAAAPVWAALDLSSPPPIGSITPNTGTFTTLIGGGGSANYGQLTGGATTKAVQFQTLGTDTNISMAFQSKGTGGIDLAAGSRGVNISNGGTVTAITRTAGGNSDYTSFPTVAISAPTTAGGVQATATVAYMAAAAATINLGGTGYTLNDVVTLVGGTVLTVAATFTVSAVTGGVVTAVTAGNFQNYTTLPTNPVSVTGGTGTGLTLNVKYVIGAGAVITITTAGSGYVEQPTVTFSGGGGSGAAAYATVGTGTIIRTLGATGTTGLSFYTPGGEALRLVDSGATATNYLIGYGAGAASTPTFGVAGSDTNITFNTVTKGSGGYNVYTNWPANPARQFAVAHTASAVNYVQVTGGASGAPGVVTMSAQGSSTDVDIAVTPKGAGNVRFATYTAGVIAQAGYITVKDSGGTVRRLLVG